MSQYDRSWGLRDWRLRYANLECTFCASCSAHQGLKWRSNTRSEADPAAYNLPAAYDLSPFLNPSRHLSHIPLVQHSGRTSLPQRAQPADRQGIKPVHARPKRRLARTSGLGPAVSPRQAADPLACLIPSPSITHSSEANISHSAAPRIRVIHPQLPSIDDLVLQMRLGLLRGGDIDEIRMRETPGLSRPAIDSYADV